MKMYVVKVTSYLPYPITREYTQKCTSFNTAISRSIKAYRKDPRISKRKVTQLSVSAGVGTF